MHVDDLEQYQGLVYFWAKKKYDSLPATGKNRIELNELISAGAIGLYDASVKFSPDKGAKFETYASYRIRGAILDELKNCDILKPDDRGKVNELEETIRAMEQLFGQYPSLEELAEAMDLTPAQIEKIRELCQIAEDLLDNLDETERDPQPLNPEKNQLAMDTNDCLGILDILERRILLLRFWADTKLEAIGAMLQLSTATIWRAEASAQLKMRQCMEGKGWGPEDLP